MINAVIEWSNRDGKFLEKRYSRAHTWTFDGGTVIEASSSPDIVPVPMSDPTAIDPEEAFVAAISSCHMLWFLSISSRAGFVVDEYRDCAMGEMHANENGKLFVANVRLRPMVKWGGEREPNHEETRQLHHQAHAECFIANSVKTNIFIEV